MQNLKPFTQLVRRDTYTLYWTVSLLPSTSESQRSRTIQWLNQINDLSFVTFIDITKKASMETKKDSPGVYIPPPLFYVLTFLSALFIQKKVSIDDSLFHLQAIKIVGILLLAISLIFLFTSLRTFFLSKNTLILIKPASSLQTNGIYSISRNPMYVGLALVYFGITCLIGNWWNIILFPLLFLIIQEYIIKREEKYLDRAFGVKYLDYKKGVRRWL